MKFENNTKWDTKQLRRIIAAVVNRYLSARQRKNLEIVVFAKRGLIMVPAVNSMGRAWRGDYAGYHAHGVVDAHHGTCRATVAMRIPNDASVAAIVNSVSLWCGLYTKKKQTTKQLNAFRERAYEMPLEKAAPKVKKKKTALEKAQTGLAAALLSAVEWKDKMLRAANKVQEHEKKVKYHTARIVLLKKQQSGEVRTKTSPKVGDRGFRIVRRKRGT